MPCPKCGTPAEPNDAFCVTCGTSLRASAPPPQPGGGSGNSVWPLHNSLAVWDDVSAKRLATKVNRGAELRVVGRDGDYYTVRLPDDTIGHVLASSVSEIRSSSESTHTSGGLAVATSNGSRASFLQRVVGYSLDGIIANVLSFLVAIVLFILFVPDPTQRDLDAVEGGVAIVGPLVYLIYKWLMDSRGGTLGKLIVGLRVVNDTTMEPPGLGAGFLRTLVSLGSGLALGLGYLRAAWDREGKTWHDHAAGTIVVRR